MAEINVSLKLDDKYADDMKKILDDVVSAVEKIKADELEKYIIELEELGNTYTINNQQAAENSVKVGEVAIKELNDGFLLAVQQTIPEFTKDAIIRNMETYTDWIVDNIEMQSTIPKAYATSTNKEINKLIAETGKKLDIALTDPKLMTEINKELNKFTKEALRRGEKITAAKIDFWSRDQVGNLVKDQTKALFDNYNLETYIWRTRGDNRVRPDHAVMDGVIVPFGKSPIGVDPGEDWACRCGYDVNSREVKQKM
jgi:SPP1 gp7 family putative phage head morphogenesis protein